MLSGAHFDHLLDVVVDFQERWAGRSVIWFFHKYAVWLKMKLDSIVSKYFIVEVSYLYDQSDFGPILEEFSGLYKSQLFMQYY